MAQNNRIKTTELDFDQIKANLKLFLQGQEKFSDYNFDGAALSILLDVLAYNTHYNALYDNLVVNESFLDSASKRASVVSKAKELGYVPRSSQCATAVIDVVVNSSSGTTLVLNKNTAFTTQVGNSTYTFYTEDDTISERTLNQYIFRNVKIKEGNLLNYQFVVTDPTAQYTMPNTGIDTSTITVLVQDESESSNFNVFTNSNSILTADGESLIYFVSENDKGQQVLQFGDGLVGKALVPGNIIDVTYQVSSGAGPNGARAFSYAGAQLGTTIPFVNTTTPAFGGSGLEDIDSIKWNAPRAYAAQNRCVTLDDYRVLVNSLYSNARSINVWGGEQHNPPSYGDVYISVVPNSGQQLTDGEKAYIINNILGPRKVVTVQPKFIDPDYIRVMLDVTYYYNPKETIRSTNTITSLVHQTISNYNDTNLRKFGGIFRYSALTKQIDNCENSIKNSITTVKLVKTITPVFNQTHTYTIDLGNPIYNSGVPEYSILSSGMYILGRPNTIQYIDDLPTPGTNVGKIRSYYYEANGDRTFTNTDIGTIDYAKGIIVLNNVAFINIDGAELTITIKPQSNDVVSVRNQIVSIPVNMVTVNAKFDTVADNYSPTSSRN